MKRKRKNDINVEGSGEMKGKEGRKVGKSVNIYIFFKMFKTIIGKLKRKMIIMWTLM